MDASKIARPVTPADYETAYRANQEEARGLVERLDGQYRRMREGGRITQRVEGGWLCSDVDARRVLEDLLRARSDLSHWTRRLAESRSSDFDVTPFGKRFSQPPERAGSTEGPMGGPPAADATPPSPGTVREPGDDDDCAF